MSYLNANQNNMLHAPYTFITMCVITIPHPAVATESSANYPTHNQLKL